MGNLLIICGPTGTGKTALALSLAQTLRGELVSADSRQIYRDMNIGTGKDLPPNAPFTNLKLISRSKDEDIVYGYYTVEGVRIWLLDLIKPNQSFSVAHYQDIARRTIGDIWSRGALPIIVGGTGLYIRAILFPIATITIPPNPRLRQTLASFSTNDLGSMLGKVDPKRWEGMNRSDSHNNRRLIRAIEIAAYRKKKSKGPETTPNSKKLPVLNTLQIGLTAPYKELYRRIDERVEKRVNAGMERELASLVHKGYGWDSPGLTALGYRGWREYFNGTLSREEMLTQWKFSEHAYARRQLTWFKKEGSIHWFDITGPIYRDNIQSLVRAWYT